MLFYRTHPGGVTHADPRGTFLEMSYATLRNLVPLIERLAAWPSLSCIIEAWIGNPEFAALRPLERYRLLGMLLADPPVGDFTAFRRAITDGMGQHPDLALVTAGQRLLAQASHTVAAREAAAREAAVREAAAREAAAREAAAWEAAALLASQSLAEARNQLDQILQSTMWKATFPLRRLGSNHPGVARRLRHAMKLVWWSMRLKLPSRLRAVMERRRAVTLATPDASTPPVAVPPLASARGSSADLRHRHPAGDDRPAGWPLDQMVGCRGDLKNRDKNAAIL